jgi:hypothetical protein
MHGRKYCCSLFMSLLVAVHCDVCVLCTVCGLCTVYCGLCTVYCVLKYCVLSTVYFLVVPFLDVHVPTDAGGSKLHQADAKHIGEHIRGW